MPYPSGHLAENPLPPGIVGALGLRGYQLLADVAGVGAGRLGQQAFLLVAPDPDPAQPSAGTQISLHQPKLKSEQEVSSFTQLAAQLGYLRLIGYRLALDRHGLRSRVHVVNPGSGAIVETIPDRHPGRLLGGGAGASRLLASVSALPAPGAPPALEDPEVLRQVFLALALRDESLSGADAAEVVERALAISKREGALDPVAALEAAKRDQLGSGTSG